MRINVLYVIINLELGGSEKQLLKLAGGLDRARFDPSVCCLMGGGELLRLFEQRGVPVRIFRFPPLDYSRKARTARVLSSMVFKLARFMRRQNPAIVHGVLPLAFVAGGLAARLAGVRVLVTSRRGLGRYKEGKPLLRRLENIVNVFSDAVVANSRAVERDTIARERIDGRKLRVIYNGVRIPEESESADISSLLGERICGPTVCLPANFFPYKGHEDFLEAAVLVRNEINDARFVLVGDGRLRGEIERRIAKSRLSENVILAGRRPDAERVMAACDAVALSSHEEGLPNVILEAMAAARPVVSTNVGGVPEIVEEGLTGYLVPPRDPASLARAIVKLLKERGAAAEMGRRGRERVRERFSVGAMVGAYEKLYEELMRKKAAVCQL